MPYIGEVFGKYPNQDVVYYIDVNKGSSLASTAVWATYSIAPKQKNPQVDYNLFDFLELQLLQSP